ncbi:DNA processing protein DprA, partial [Propionibacterium freudenreichii]|nr:DNA processing protein DprA [Propionibacterium freudenreichii]
LSAATVVVEAGVRSGSMAVARRAHELGRAVGAVPGPVSSATSVGPHQLLRDRIASLVADPADLASLVAPGHKAPASGPRADYEVDHSRPRTSEPSRKL